jgi:regulatory protein
MMSSPKLNRSELKKRALDLLARREHSRAELARRLLVLAADPDDVIPVLNELAERHWQSDVRFAEAWVHQRSPGHGSRRLQHELQQKGLSATDIRTALDALPDDEYARAHALWARRFGTAPQDQRARQQQQRFLLYRGFSVAVVLQVLKAAGAYSDDDAELMEDEGES